MQRQDLMRLICTRLDAATDSQLRIIAQFVLALIKK